MAYVNKISKKKFENLSDNDLIWIHLFAQPTFSCKDKHILSTLGLALQEKRSASVMANTQLILPTLATFSILDQIGNTYINTAVAPVSSPGVNGIKMALHNFAGISFNSLETKALYAFRNAMMHDASLVNTGRDGNGPFHRFSFDKSLSKLVELPPIPWDGNWGNAPYTKINREMFYELTEMAIDSAKTAFENECLQLRVGTDELFDKYLLTLP